jgi:hypothetical protein
MRYLVSMLRRREIVQIRRVALKELVLIHDRGSELNPYADGPSLCY